MASSKAAGTILRKRNTGVDTDNKFEVVPNLINLSNISQLPAPVGNVITDPTSGVTYDITSTFDAGANELVFTGDNVVVRGIGAQSVITSTTAGTVISVTGSVTIKDLNIVGTSAAYLVDGEDASVSSLVLTGLGFVGGATTECLRVSNYKNFLVDLCGFVSGLSGVLLANTVNNATISRNQFSTDISGEQICLGTGLSHALKVEGNASTLAATSTFITALPNNGNITATGSGLITGNNVDNALGGTLSTGLSGLDLRWLAQGNNGITGSDRLQPAGWGFYADDNTGGAIVAGTGVGGAVKFTSNGLGATTSEAHLPLIVRGTGSLWDTSTNDILPITEGDSYDFRISFNVTGVSANPDRITCVLDIGGAAGITIPIAEDTKSYTGSPQSFIFTFPYFTLSTFIANGGQIFLYTDTGTADLEDRRILIERISSGAN